MNDVHKIDCEVLRASKHSLCFVEHSVLITKISFVVLHACSSVFSSIKNKHTFNSLLLYLLAACIFVTFLLISFQQSVLLAQTRWLMEALC